MTTNVLSQPAIQDRMKPAEAEQLKQYIRITNMSTDLMPQFAFEKLNWYETIGFNMWLLLGCILIFLSIIPIGLIRFIRNRRQSGERKPASRGVLLPKMQGVFGKWDWVANGVLFGFYHLHQPWGILSNVVFGWIVAFTGKRFHSN
jgi:hypothetical protein